MRIIFAPELRAWIDAQAEDIGCDAATWVKMLVVAARKQGCVPMATPRVPAAAEPRAPPGTAGSVQQHPLVGDYDAQAMVDANSQDSWRGPVEDAPGDAVSRDIADVIEQKLAEAEVSGATVPAQPVEMFSSRPPAPVGSGTTRALRSPPSRYSVGAQPAHLRAL